MKYKKTFRSFTKENVSFVLLHLEEVYPYKYVKLSVYKYVLLGFTEKKEKCVFPIISIILQPLQQFLFTQFIKETKS